MKKINNLFDNEKIIFKLSLGLLIISGLLIFCGLFSYNKIYSQAANDSKEVEILFTHDLHSFLSSHKLYDNGELIDVGGMARLATLIEEKKQMNPDLLLLDGGDMAIGTLYQTLYYTEALELCMLGELGFDGTTFGNHDFDYDADKLCRMFNVAAEKQGDKLPHFLVSNIDWNYDNQETQDIYEAAKKCKLDDYVIVEKGNVKIGLFGIFGKTARSDSPTLKLSVVDQIESAKATVNKIKASEDVDMIVCISHSGTDKDLKSSEDEQLALAVPEIDVILSAHTHTVLNEPIVHGDTYIIGCGCYGELTGLSSFIQAENGRWKIKDYQLIYMDEDIPENQEIKEQLDSYNELIEKEYLSNFGLSLDQTLCYNPYSFESIDDMYYIHTEHNLGNLMSDSYRYAVSQELDENVDIAVVPAGTVRGTFIPGEIKAEDAFQCYSLGIGFDDLVGNPLVEFYLTGDEVKMIPEVDASLSALMPTATLYCSGLSYTIGEKRLFLNKAYDISLNPIIRSEEKTAIEDDKLYSIVTDLYTARMLGSVSRLSKGLIKLEPKYSDGKLLESEEDYLWQNVVIYKKDGKEYKTWCAFSDYFMSFDKNDSGISVMPDYYNCFHDRKVIDNNFNIINFFKDTNKYFWMISAVVIGAFGAIIITIFAVVKIVLSVKKKKNNVQI